jgi:hypothetical protein
MEQLKSNSYKSPAIRGKMQSYIWKILNTKLLKIAKRDKII